MTRKALPPHRPRRQGDLPRRAGVQGPRATLIWSRFPPLSIFIHFLCLHYIFPKLLPTIFVCFFLQPHRRESSVRVCLFLDSEDRPLGRRLCRCILGLRIDLCCPINPVGRPDVSLQPHGGGRGVPPEVRPCARTKKNVIEKTR